MTTTKDYKVIEKVRARMVDPLDTIDIIHHGIKTSVLFSLEKVLSIKRSEITRILPISPASYDRLRGKPDIEKSVLVEHILSLIKVAVKGVTVFEGQELFRDWLQHSLLALGDNKPIDLLDTKKGCDLIYDTLTSIEYGVY